MKFSILTIQAKRINKNPYQSKSFKGNDVIKQFKIGLSSRYSKTFFNEKSNLCTVRG